jgi:hypothetical protein
MDTYTIITSLAGIFGLIALVAVLTFFEDGRKWIRFRFLKRLRKKRNLSNGFLLNDKDRIFLEKEHTLFMKHHKEVEKLRKEMLEDRHHAV